MEFQFVFSLIEAACIVCEYDYDAVVEEMARNDRNAALVEMEKALRLCDACDRQRSRCPEWTSYYPEDGMLVCPHNFSSPPSRDIQNYLPSTVRTHPYDGEFSDEFVRCVQMLREALRAGHLQGSEDQIARPDLMAFLEKHYPHVKPDVLFAGQLMPLGDSKAQVVLGALLTYLEKQRYFKFETAKLAISDAIPGRGFGKRTLEDIFSNAKASFSNAGGDSKKLK